MWWVYIIQSQVPRTGKRGQPLPGFLYVGSTTDPARRIRQHNGQIAGGGRYTSTRRPWKARALFGPYADRKEAFKAEMALKRLRGSARLAWSPAIHHLCRGAGLGHPWVTDPNWHEPSP